MKHIRAIVTVGLLLGTIALSGCESKQHKLQRLQTEYAAAYKQYQIDCVDPMSSGAADALTYDPSAAAKGAPKPKVGLGEEKKRTEKCQADDAKTNKIQQQILDATGK
jgi:hypothetical protein